MDALRGLIYGGPDAYVEAIRGRAEKGKEDDTEAVSGKTGK
jgi:hypothetical protein